VLLAVLHWRLPSADAFAWFQSAKHADHEIDENGKAAAVAISPDGQYGVRSADAEKQSLRVQNVATRSDVQVLAPDLVEFAGVTFSPDGNYIYFVRSDKSTAQYRYLYQMPVLVNCASADSGHRCAHRLLAEWQAVCFSARNSGASDGGGPHRAGRRTGERLLAALPANAFFQYGPTWSPDGKMVAIAALGVGKETNWG